jgi:hypothetical protein
MAKKRTPEYKAKQAARRAAKKAAARETRKVLLRGSKRLRGPYHRIVPQMQRRSQGILNHAVTANSSAHDRYLYGFMDTRFPSRGPANSGSVPTHIVKFRAAYTSTLMPHSYSGGQSPRFDSSGRVMFVVCPFVVTATETGPGSNRNVQPLYFAPTNVALNAASPLLPPYTDYYLPPVAFDSPFPDVFNYGGSSSSYLNPSCSSPMGSLAYRTLGLRATITFETPSMTACGHITSGDNQDVYGPLMSDTYQFRADGENIEEVNEQYQSQLLTQPIETGTGWDRLIAGGMAKSASIYEATFIPATDRVTEYRKTIRGHIVDQQETPALDARDSVGSDLVDSPALIFIVSQGVAANQINFTINIDWNIELCAERGTSIAWTSGSAMRAPRFVPQWQEMACCVPGGPIGACAMSTMNDSSVMRGQAQALTRQPPPAVLNAQPANGAIAASQHNAVVALREQQVVQASGLQRASQAVAKAGQYAQQGRELVTTSKQAYHDVKSFGSEVKGLWNAIRGRGGPIVEEVLDDAWAGASYVPNHVIYPLIEDAGPMAIMG